MIINHFLFADDAVVFVPSAKKLLDACSKFAVTHNVILTSLSHSALLFNPEPL